MDVDVLTISKRNDLMKEGHCFNCKGLRHLSKNCPDKTKKKKPEEKKIYRGKELHTYICSLMKEMTEVL